MIVPVVAGFCAWSGEVALTLLLAAKNSGDANCDCDCGGGGVCSSVESPSSSSTGACVSFTDCTLGMGAMDDGADTVAAEIPVSCSAPSGLTGMAQDGVRTT